MKRPLATILSLIAFCVPDALAVFALNSLSDKIHFLCMSKLKLFYLFILMILIACPPPDANLTLRVVFEFTSISLYV